MSMRRARSVKVRKKTGQTDGRTPDRCITFTAIRGQRNKHCNGLSVISLVYQITLVDVDSFKSFKASVGLYAF